MNLLSLAGKLSQTSNSMSSNAATAVKAEKKALFAWYVSAAKARPIVRSVLELILPVQNDLILATFVLMSLCQGKSTLAQNSVRGACSGMLASFIP